MRTTTLLFVSALLALAACGDNNGGADAGADAAGGGGDSGTDGGGDRPDTGTDAGRDAGPSCTTGCTWVEVAGGLGHTCARRENGEVKCWGRGQDGEIGDDNDSHFPGCPVEGAADVDCAARPQRVALDVAATTLSVRGGFSGCALAGAGDVHCWGREGFNIGGAPAAVRYAPEPYPGVSMIDAVSDSYHTICFLEADGTPLCAGVNSAGQVGSGDFLEALGTEQVMRENPTDPGMAPVALDSVLELDTGTFFATFGCARTSTEVLCWGSDEGGQLGTGARDYGPDCMSGTSTFSCSNIARPIPTADLDGADVAELALGSAHACARMTDGTVRCWGQNLLGQVGVGTAMPSYTSPTVVGGVSNVVQLVAGSSHTCALMTDGTVSCWGVNNQGQLGDGDMTHGNCMVGTSLYDCSLAPVPVMGITDAVFIAAGNDHTCVIHDGGMEISCWGSNETLQLGDGPNTRPTPADRAPRFAPVLVEGL